MNRFGYALGNPVTNYDPDGEEAISIGAGAGICAAPGAQGPCLAAGAALTVIWVCAKTGVCTRIWEEAKECFEDDDEPCPPCQTVSGKIVPVGTIAYRPLDTPSPGTTQHGITGPHYNLYKANQAPRNSPQPCKCFWQPIGAVAPADLPNGAIPIEPFAN